MKRKLQLARDLKLEQLFRTCTSRGDIDWRADELRTRLRRAERRALDAFISHSKERFPVLKEVTPNANA